MPRHEEPVFVLEELPKPETTHRLTDSTSKVPPKLRTATIRIQSNDRVAEVIKGIDSGRVKGKSFSKAIEDFSPEELGRLADKLLLYYQRKFS